MKKKPDPDASERALISANALVAGGEIGIESTPAECVERFLAHFREQLEPHAYYAHTEHRLNYQLMRRFIFTAYKNLVEMDQGISQGKVREPQETLIFVQKHYLELNRAISRPIATSYERVFLAQQHHFRDAQTALEMKKAQSEYLQSRILQAKTLYEEYRARLHITPPSAPNYLELEQLYKRANGDYVDRMHEQSKLKEEITRLHEKIERFRQAHFGVFETLFRAQALRLVEEVLQILDGLSYEYDTLLWEEARDSEVIRKFFAEAKIQGSFSSKTYLKYYLKNLDVQHSSEEQQKMRELLEYLEHQSRRHIFILGNDSDELLALKRAVESIDKDYTVVTAQSGERIFVEYQRVPFHLVIIDSKLKQGNALELLQRFWQSTPHAKEQIPVLMRFDDPTYEQINQAGRAGIRYFLRTRAKKEEFCEKIMQIL